MRYPHVHGLRRPAPYQLRGFLVAEQKSLTKHEWLDGIVYAMAGGTLEHSRLAANLVAILRGTHSDRVVFQSDAMTYVRATNLSTYADVAMVSSSARR